MLHNCFYQHFANCLILSGVEVSHALPELIVGPQRDMIRIIDSVA